MSRKHLKTALAEILNENELKQLIHSFDIIGDIAVIKIREPLKGKYALIGKAIMDANKHVKTVLSQPGAVSGTFRLRKLEWVCGEKKTVTTHKEYGCRFNVDLTTVYFSPRLSYERMRIAKLVQPNEIIVNMFAGVGCYSIIISKYSKAEKIYSIDINPNAVISMKENIRLNKVENKVFPIEGDAGVIIKAELQGKADRVLMPLPEKAYEYLGSAVAALKPSGGGIHFYNFTHARKDEDPIEKVSAKVSEKMENLNINFKTAFSRIVRPVGPNWYQVVLDVIVGRKLS